MLSAMVLGNSGNTVLGKLGKHDKPPRQPVPLTNLD